MSKQFTVKVPTINLVGLVAPIVRKIDDRKSYKAARETMKGQMIEEGRLIRFQAQVEEDLRKEQEKLAKEAAKAAEAEKVEKVEVVS